MTRNQKAPKATPALALFVALLVGSLAACGGGSSAGATATPASADTGQNAATAATPVSIAATASTVSAAPTATISSALAAELAQTAATPTFHMAPALPPEPSMIDAGGTNASAHMAPRTFDVDPSVAGLSTRGLEPQTLARRLAEGTRTRVAAASSGTAPAAQRVLTGQVYTPAQIRVAYGLPDLPAVGAAISASVAATLGAGQTIYLVDAYHDATALSDLNAFSTRFGLPNCTSTPIATTAALPLPAASTTACSLSIVYATSASGMTATVPAYNLSWAPESKIDVQWAHAIAPLARLVLIETPDAMTNNLLGGIGLANHMGAGVVSMSFGLAEPGWATTEDAQFTTAGMTYVAATGDIGAKVQWPAVSPNVLAVGGTGMNWSGSGTRYEQAWANSGGGVSLYEPLPAWQSGVTPVGGSALAKRAVADVSFNANPMTGEYVALTLPAAATAWTAYGGTSIAAPQWAGIIAVANAIRVANAKALLGDIHSLIYTSIAKVPGTYAAAFSDVVDGNNGTCATCVAGTGFDTSTGWGTPNVTALMPLLTGVSSSQTTTPPPSTTPATTPTVPGGSLVARNAVAFTQSLNVTTPANVTTTFALTGAPSGLTVDTTGTLHWTSPAKGQYTVTARATTSAGASASANYTLKVIANTAPIISSAATMSATAGTRFSVILTATNPNTGNLTFSLAGAPAGLTTTTSGALLWASPVGGTWHFTATVTDNYGLTSTTAFTLNVTAAPSSTPTPTTSAPTSTTNHAPTMTSLSVLVRVGAPFSMTLNGSDADGDALWYSLAGAPAGASLTSAGLFSWPTPVAGSRLMTVTIHDSKGATGTATVTLTAS